MATTDFDYPVVRLKGRASKNHKEYYTNRYGKTILSNYPLHRDLQKITVHQQQLNSKFSQAVKQAKIELADPQLREAWQKRFDDQSKIGKYKTLRGFVIAQIQASL